MDRGSADAGHHRLKHWLGGAALLAAMSPTAALAQDAEAGNSGVFSIVVENDSLSSGADRNYTSGIKLAYVSQVDELQGVKRGIMEMADLILVNKADGDLKAAATRTCSDYAGALRLLRKRAQDPEGFPKAMMVSAIEDHGLDAAWEEMQALVSWRKEQGFWDARRAAQAEYWFTQDVRQGVLAQLETGAARAEMKRLGRLVAEGRMTPSAAAREMLDDHLAP